MSDSTKDPLDERESAVREWEKQTQTPLIANGNGKRAGGIAIAAIAAAALCLVWYAKNGGSAEAKSQPGGADLTIAERKPVPKLKNDSSPDAGSPAEPAVRPSPTPASTAVGQTADGQDEQQAAQRREQERRMLEARLKSAIIPPNVAGQATAGTVHAGDSMQGPNESGSPPSVERGAQDPNSRFARAVSGAGVATSLASRIDNLEYKVLQGKLVEAVLEPRAVSDLPGTICATVQRDVFGAQGRVPLIPWGSRVCGVYSAELRKGQDRLFAVWNTLRTPDGVQVTLDSIGADQLGTAGMGGTVNRHFAQIFGTSVLISIIGAGAANVGVSSNDRYNSAAAYRDAVQQAAAQASQQALQPYLAIPPTVTVPTGEPIRIYVNRDLDFTPVYRAQLDAAKADPVTFIH